MDFPSADIFSSEVDDSPRVEKGLLERQTYIPRVCPLVPDYDNFSEKDREAVKMKADLAYYLKDYMKALELYKKVYTEFGCTGLAVRRDLLECLARSCLAVGAVKEALGYWEEIQGGWTGHEDHRLVVAQLRVDIGRQQGDTGHEMGALLCKIIEMHSTMARYWVWLADWYRDNMEDIKELWSLSRGREVGRLEGVQCSVNLSELDVRIRSSNVDRILQEKIFETVSRDVKEKSKEEEVNTDFEDLGASVRLKKVEEALAEKYDGIEDTVDNERVIINFEQKWFKG